MNAKAAAPAPKPARKKPPNAGKGRKKGVPNKTTALLKDAVLEAAKQAGGGRDGLIAYLKKQAQAENPGPFMALLGRVLPLQIGVDPDSDGNVIFQTVYESAAKDH